MINILQYVINNTNILLINNNIYYIIMLIIIGVSNVLGLTKKS